MRFEEAAEHAKNGRVIVSNGCRIIYVGDAVFSSPQHNLSGVLAAQYMRIATAVKSTVFYPFTPSAVDLTHDGWAVEGAVETTGDSVDTWGAVIIRASRQFVNDLQAILLGSTEVRILAAADMRDGHVEFSVEHRTVPKTKNGEPTPRGYVLVEVDEVFGGQSAAIVSGENKYSL